MSARIPSFIVLCSVLSPPANAQDGGDWDRADSLARSCRVAVSLMDRTLTDLTWEDTASISDCYGYLRGFIDGHNMAVDLLKVGKIYCVPSGVSNIQLARVLIRAADDRPELGHLPRETLAEYAFRVAFPCSDQGN